MQNVSECRVRFEELQQHLWFDLLQVRTVLVALVFAALFSPSATFSQNTNGVLLATFNNPTPGIFEQFGYSVAGVGNDRVLIGAYQDNERWPTRPVEAGLHDG